VEHTAPVDAKYIRDYNNMDSFGKALLFIRDKYPIPYVMMGKVTGRRPKDNLFLVMKGPVFYIFQVITDYS
jgi:hypothetical protein